MNIQMIDLFAGIGGVKLGFEQAGFNSVFSNDSDRFCKVTFDLNFSNTNEKLFSESGLYLENISNVDISILPEFTLLAAGFPCQAFSVAGYRKGFKDEGRGDLFFEIIRILRARKPQAILLENVKNLKSHDNGKTIEVIYRELEKAGYFVKDAILNTMDYANIPQNRERIFIVGFRDERLIEQFNFPKKKKLTKTIFDCLEKKRVDDKYYYNDKPLFKRIKNDVVRRDTTYQWRRKYVRENKSNVCPTLTANMGTGGHNVPIILDNFGIRKLTPRECANFQGFPASYKLPNLADSHLYKQIGNSVSVPVIKLIAKEIKKTLLG
jgi:DNA (cytosine-5)-methyltransferase 1